MKKLNERFVEAIEARTLDEYSKEELMSLYKRLDLYIITEYLLNNKDDVNIFDINRLWNGTKYSLPEWQSFWYTQMYASNVDNALKNETNSKKINKLKSQSYYYKFVGKTLWFLASGWMKVFDDEKNDLDCSKPMSPNVALNHLVKHFPEQLKQLTINDEFNISNRVATDFKAYQFFWLTLQFLEDEELKQLLKLADKGIKCKWESDLMVKKSGGAHNMKMYEVTNLFPLNDREKMHLSIGQKLQSKKWIMDNYPVSRRELDRWVKQNWIKELK